YARVRTGGMGGRARSAAAKEKAEHNWLLHLMKDQPDGTADSEASADVEPGEPIAPMLATLGRRADIRDEDDWAFEMKWDGVRVIATARGTTGRLPSRGGKDTTAAVPELAELPDAVEPAPREAGETGLARERLALAR